MKQLFTNKQSVVILLFLISVVFAIPPFLFSQEVSGPLQKRIRIGELQSHFTAYGAERAWNDVYYAGMVWPADYSYQDNAVIERSWLAADDFTDENGRFWDAYAVYLTAGYVGESIFPVEHKAYAKFAPPEVIVDGRDVTEIFMEDVDSVNANQIPDRIISNIVNTSLGLTMSRRIYGFSQQYHDDYFIKEYTFTNTGNTDYDDVQELNAPLKGVRISWGVRYSVCREGAPKFDNQQSWGKYTWVSRRGEDYPAHAGERIDESNPIVEWLRCGFAWTGQSERVAYDNIGAPDILGSGRLISPQHAGLVVIHVDRSATDGTDDPNQPAVLGWHAGDTYPSLGDLTEEAPMVELYDMISGNPYKGTANGGTNRFYEDNITSIIDPVSPWTLHNDGGGTNVWVAYGPFDLQPGESIRIVEAEAVNGLSRTMCENVGRVWKQAYDNKGTSYKFDMPNGSQITGTYNDQSADLYKNSWVYTGWDSILQVFGRAKRNFDLNYQIPQPPLPPPSFHIKSGGDRIELSWEPSPSEVNADFGGYRIFRSVGKTDTTYNEIWACGHNTDNPSIVHSYYDITPVRLFSYYYYIVAFNDGSNNTTGEANPVGELQSGRFYTRSTEPAFLRRKAGMSFSDIRVVPNPYNLKARNLNYKGEPDKIAFLDIPPLCVIKIYTERGDLIQTIEHTDGSGDESWNLVTTSRQIVASGLYIAYFEVTEDYVDSETGQLLYKKGDSTYRKFVVIR